MGVLYIIGQGATVQMASDLSTIGHTTMSHFLHQWIDWLVQTQYSKHVWLPETEAQIKHVTIVHLSLEAEDPCCISFDSLPAMCFSE
eukprot:3314336-Pleurochrysis_carterae.AAC.1